MALVRAFGCLLAAGAAVGHPSIGSGEAGNVQYDDVPAESRDRLLRREVLQAKASPSRATSEVDDTDDFVSDTAPPPAAPSLLEVGDLGSLVAEGARRARRHKLFEKMEEEVGSALEKREDAASILEEFAKVVSKSDQGRAARQGHAAQDDGSKSARGEKGEEDRLQERLATLVKDPATREQVEELFEGHGEAEGHHDAGDHEGASHHHRGHARAHDPHAEQKEQVLEAVRRLVANAKDKDKAMRDVQRLIDMAKDPQHEGGELMELAEHDEDHEEAPEEQHEQREEGEHEEEPHAEVEQREEDEQEKPHHGHHGHHGHDEHKPAHQKHEKSAGHHHTHHHHKEQKHHHAAHRAQKHHHTSEKHHRGGHASDEEASFAQQRQGGDRDERDEEPEEDDRENRRDSPEDHDSEE